MYPPADLVVLLAGRPPAGPPVASGNREWIRWRDFWVPADEAVAVGVLRSAHARAATERALVTCGGGVGRTGTALAAMAVLEGMGPRAAVAWVRGAYHRRAVEVPWQRRFLVRLAERG